MKRFLPSLVAGLTLASLAPAPRPVSQEMRTVESANAVLKSFTDAPRISIPRALLHDAVVSPNQGLAFAAPVPGPTLGGGLPGLLASFAGLGMIGLQRSRKRRNLL